MTPRTGQLRAGAVSWVRSVRAAAIFRSVAMLSLVAVAGSAGLAGWFALPCAAQGRDERAVRAAYVFNLTKYVEWPERSNEIVIGFVGTGPMGEVLQNMLAGKTSESRSIRLLLAPSDEQLDQCHILYISDSPPQKIRTILERVHDKSVLTVGETDSFPRENGMVGLVRAGEQIQIHVNLQAVHEARLKISSRLLNLSTIVQPAGKGPN